MIIDKGTNNGIKYEIHCNDGIYTTIADIGYGPYELDETHIKEIAEQDEFCLEYAIFKTITAHRAEVKNKEKKETSQKLSEHGEYLGTKKHYFDLDNRLYFKLKSMNINMTKFINLAIAEKLTRDE